MDSTKELVNTINQKSQEIKDEYNEMSKRLMALEQSNAKSVGFSGQPDASQDRLTVLKTALAASGNATAKVVVPMQKSTLLQGVSAGKLSPTERNIGVFAQAQQLSLAAQLHSFPTDASVIDYTVIGSTDAAQMQGGEGNLKHELAITSTPNKVEMNTFAGWVKVSTQALNDQININQAIDSVLRGAIQRGLDNHIMSVVTANATQGNSGVTPMLSALMAAAQIQSLGHAATVFVNPMDYAAITLTVGTNGEFIDVPQSYQGIIKPASGVTSGKYLATTLDGSGLDLAIRESLNIDIGTSGDDFIKNLRVLLAEVRAVALIRDPSLVIVGDLVAAKTK